LGLWGVSLVRGALREAQKLAAETLRIAEGIGFSVFRLGAHYAIGLTFLYQGLFAAADEHLVRVGDLYDPEQRDYYGVDSAQDPKATALAYSALARWFLGGGEEARAAVERSIAFARELDHPFSVLMTLDVAGTIDQLAGDVSSLRKRSEMQMDLARE